MDLTQISSVEIKRKNNQLTSEKELVDNLILNLDIFVNNFLGEEIEFFKREFTIGNQMFAKGTKPKVDIYIRTKNGKNIFIECKNPRNMRAESNNAIAQCLDYYIFAKDNNLALSDLILFTTHLAPSAYRIITHFNLPIKVFLLKEENIVQLV